MKLSSLGPSFSGKYQLNANQEMPSQEDCLKRDYMLGVACGYALNGDSVSKELANFYNGKYNIDKFAPCNVVFDIPDNMDSTFEDHMNKLGQKFDKLA